MRFVKSMLALAASLLFVVQMRADVKVVSQGPVHKIIQAVAEDQSSIDVVSDSATIQQPLHLAATDSVVRDSLKGLSPGDHVQVFYSQDQTGNKNTLTGVFHDSVSVPPISRLWVLASSAGLCLLLAGCCSGLRPWRFLIGQDNRYSNSQFQIAVWFFVLISTYIATVWLRFTWGHGDFIGGVSIPRNLLLISGMSALTFAGAKVITRSKADDAQAAGNPDPKFAATATPSFLWDLTQTDGAPAVVGRPAVPSLLDFGDFQMFAITLIAVTTYIVLIFTFLGTIEYSKIISLPDVDTTILAAFGLGHGSYLAKKAAGNIGTS